jgi:hypothetical protein
VIRGRGYCAGMTDDEQPDELGAREDAADVREDEDAPRRREATAEASEAERQREAEVPGSGDDGMDATPPEEDAERFGAMRPPEGSGP